MNILTHVIPRDQISQGPFSYHGNIDDSLLMNFGNVLME